MLGEYKVSRCTRRCFTQQRPLREGEVYYSVVIDSDESFERRDYSAEAWEGPPEDAIGWWKNRMPTAERKKLVLAPPEVLIDLLRRNADRPEQAKSRYLLALMLLRRKQLREVPSKDTPLQGDEGEAAKFLHVEVRADKSQIQIPIAQVSRREVEALTEELNSLLYCDPEVEALEMDDEGSDPSEPDTDASSGIDS